MEWIREMLMELIVAAAGVVIAALAAKLGGILGKFWKEKMTDESLQNIAKICVSAVEMMFREESGETKLSAALEMASDLLEEKGMQVSEDKLRILLEAALAECKGAFEKA